MFPLRGSAALNSGIFLYILQLRLLGPSLPVITNNWRWRISKKTQLYQPVISIKPGTKARLFFSQSDDDDGGT